MFKDEVTFDFVVELLRPLIKDSNIKSFNESIEYTKSLMEGEKQKQFNWNESDLIQELFFQLS